MTEQKVKPELWVIVDDGSTDNTSLIIENLRAKYSYITSIKLPPRPRDITFHYSYVCKQGFDYAIEYCRKNEIEFKYIGLLDADTVLEEKYFEKLLVEFEKDESLGIASGGVYYDTGGKLSREMSDRSLPRGTGRLWRKECFFETGGYQIEPSPDSISNIKALLRGWKIMQYANIIQIQKRETCSANGLWDGYCKKGGMAYYLGKNSLSALVNGLYYTLKPPFYTGAAYCFGYFGSAVKRVQKISDPEIRAYYKKQGFSGLYSRVSGTYGRQSRDIYKEER